MVNNSREDDEERIRTSSYLLCCVKSSGGIPGTFLFYKTNLHVYNKFADLK